MQPTDHTTESSYPDKGDYNQLEHFRRHKVEPPAGLYVTLDDIVVVESFAALAATSFNVSMRLMTPDGQVIPFFQSFVALAQGVTPSTARINNLEGFILSLSVNQTAGLRGAVFVRMMIQRGVGSGDATRGQVLMSGYPSAVDAFGYPNSEPDQALDGRGLANVVAPANPIAGADYVIVVPAGVNWIVRSLRFQLVTAVAVANRQVDLRIDDGAGHIFADLAAPAVQAASLTGLYTWATGLNPQSTNNIQQQGLPAEMRLAGGWRILTVTTAIQAADQFSGAAIELETFIGQ